jgi:hypothetical protein
MSVLSGHVSLPQILGHDLRNGYAIILASTLLVFVVTRIKKLTDGLSVSVLSAVFIPRCLILNELHRGRGAPTRITNSVSAIGCPRCHDTHNMVESRYYLDMGLAVYL